MGRRMGPLVLLSALLVAGCKKDKDGDTDVTETDTVPPTETDTDGDTDGDTDVVPRDEVLLVGTGSGPDLLGAVYAVDAADLSQVRTVTEVAGGQRTGFNGLFEGGLTYSPSDGLFYGIASSGGWNVTGTVFFFDPKTDAIHYLATLPHVTPGGGDAVRSYHHAPILTEDGMSLLAVARMGGRDSTPCVSGGSDGAVIHVELDPTSPAFGSATVVYKLATQGAAQGLDHAPIRPGSHPVWGDSVLPGTPTLWFLTEGEHWDAQDDCSPTSGTVGLRTVGLRPKDPSDLSKPWEVEATESFADPRSGLAGPVVGWDDQQSRFMWAFHENYGDFTHVDASDGEGLHPFMGVDDECEDVVGLAVDGHYDLLCGGTAGDVTPKLFRVNAALNVFELKRRLNDWTALDHTPSGMAFTADEQKLFLLGTDPGAFLRLGLPQSYDPGRLVELSLTGLFQTHTLVEGDATVGTAFMGQPAVGGALSEPIANRYVVFYSYDGGEHDQGALVKYDRLDQTTSVVSFGTSGAAYLGGRPHVSDQGVLLPTKYAGYADTPWRGTAVADLETGALTPVMNQAAQGENTYPWWNTEFLPMAATDELWAMSPSASGSETVFTLLNPATGANVPERTIVVDTGTAWTEKLPAYRAAVAGDDLWSVTPGPAEGAHQRLSCVGHDAASSGDTQTVDFSAEVTTGPLVHEGKLLWLAGDGSLRSMAVTPSGCGSLTGLTETTLATGLGFVPSTPLNLGSDGRIYVGSADGHLMTLDPADGTASSVADLSAGGDLSTSVAGFVEEVADGVWMGVVKDVDAEGHGAARRVFRYDVVSGQVATADVSDQVGEDDPYPGVVALP